jgi:hypothetical protein
MFLNIIKAIYNKPRANIILNGEQVKPFPLVRNETGMPTLPTPIQYSFEIPSQSNKARTRNKKVFKQGRKKSNYPHLQMT